MSFKFVSGGVDRFLYFVVVVVLLLLWLLLLLLLLFHEDSGVDRCVSEKVMSAEVLRRLT